MFLLGTLNVDKNYQIAYNLGDKVEGCGKDKNVKRACS